MTEKDFNEEAACSRLRWLIAYYEMNQQEFANSIGVTKTTLNGWLSPKRGLSLDGAKRIRSTYGISMEWLFFGSLDHLPSHILKAWLSSSSD